MSRSKDIVTKSMWTRILALFMVFAIGSACASCKKSKVPSKKDVLENLRSEVGSKQGPFDFTYEELRSAWGDPDVERVMEETGIPCKAWNYNGHYLYSFLQKDDPSVIAGFGYSSALQLIFLLQDERNVFFAEFNEGRLSDWDCLSFSNDRFASGELDNASFGDLFSMEFDGTLLQSYPGMIYLFFSITPEGQADSRQLQHAQNVLDRLKIHLDPSLCFSNIIIEPNADARLKIEDNNDLVFNMTLVNGNRNRKTYVYSEDFYLERKIKDDWYIVVPPEEVHFEEKLYELPPDGQKSFSCDVKSIYGTLEPGTYRIVKELVNSEDIDNFDDPMEFYVAAEFNVDQ